MSLKKGRLPAPVLATGNIHDVPNVKLLITPRHKYVRDGGRVGSKELVVGSFIVRLMRQVTKKDFQHLLVVLDYNRSWRLIT